MKEHLLMVIAAAFILLCQAHVSIGGDDVYEDLDDIYENPRGCDLACEEAKWRQMRFQEGRQLRREADGAYSAAYSSGDDAGVVFGDGVVKRTYRSGSGRGSRREYAGGYSRSRDRQSGNERTSVGYGFGEGFASGKGISIGEGMAFGRAGGSRVGAGHGRGVYVREGTVEGFGEGIGYGDGRGAGFGSGKAFTEDRGNKDSGFRGDIGRSAGRGVIGEGYAPGPGNVGADFEPGTAIGGGYNKRNGAGPAYGRGIYAGEGRIRGYGVGFANAGDNNPRSSYGTGNGRRFFRNENRYGPGVGIGRGAARGYDTSFVNNEGGDPGSHYRPGYSEEDASRSGTDVVIGGAYDRRSGGGSAFGRGITVKEGTARGHGIGIVNVDGKRTSSSNTNEGRYNPGAGTQRDVDNSYDRALVNKGGDVGGNGNGPGYSEEDASRSGTDVVIGGAYDRRSGGGSAFGQGISVKEGTARGHGIGIANADDIRTASSNINEERHKPGTGTQRDVDNSYDRDLVNKEGDVGGNGNDPGYSEEDASKSGKDIVIGGAYDRKSGGGSAFGQGISVKEGTARGHGIGIANVHDIKPASSDGGSNKGHVRDTMTGEGTDKRNDWKIPGKGAST